MKEARVMKLLRFHETLTLEQAVYYCDFSKSTLKRELDSLVKRGLVQCIDGVFSLTPESKFWLGWHSFSS